jgi:hypothetical protein
MESLLQVGSVQVPGAKVPRLTYLPLNPPSYEKEGRPFLSLPWLKSPPSTHLHLPPGLLLLQRGMVQCEGACVLGSGALIISWKAEGVSSLPPHPKTPPVSRSGALCLAPWLPGLGCFTSDYLPFGFD